MNLATTSAYLLSPAPTKTVVRAPRLIARASTKSGTGVGERAARPPGALSKASKPKEKGTRPRPSPALIRCLFISEL